MNVECQSEHRTSNAISRRAFLQVSAAAGAGLLISIYLPGCGGTPTPAPGPTESATTAPEPTATTALEPTTTPEPTDVPEPTATPPPATSLEPNAFLRIDADGTVTIILHKCELGQGVGTTLPMIVAEELEADWSAVHVEQVRVDDIYGKPRTSGSDSTQDLYLPLRRAGATARTLLIAAAAQTWGVEVETCYAENGVVIHRPTGQQLTYGELVETAATLPTPSGRELTLKEPDEFRLIGTNVRRLENPRIVDGSAVYGLDVHIPGMLYAAIARCPVFGGQVADVDANQLGAIEGIYRVLQISADSIAVVADSTWAALQGQRALQVTWDEGPNADMSSDSIRANLAKTVPSASNAGDATTLEAIYEVPFLAHVTPEPMNCVADVREDSCEVWAPTQNPEQAKARARSITGLPNEAIRVHIPLIGCGLGRRLQVDYVEQAVQVSKAMGLPVKVVWTREDDLQHDFYHPYSYHHISASLDEPNHLATRSRESTHIPTGAWRSATNLAPAFVEESFMDEVAAALGRDPYELRMELPRYRRLQDALELAASKGDWGAPLPDGWGRGIACWSTWNVTPTAHVVEVSVDEDGVVQVHRVVCGVDCGLVINPDIVQAQMEGGIVMGLTAALKGEITLENGRVQQGNFHDYPLWQIDEMPAIEVYIVSSDRAPSGAGEMAVPPIIPAVANAVFAATGKRIRRFPIRPADLREA
jgi:isoquinoline 1-oxidoreductase beta subunit